MPIHFCSNNQFEQELVQYSEKNPSQNASLIQSRLEPKIPRQCGENLDRGGSIKETDHSDPCTKTTRQCGENLGRADAIRETDHCHRALAESLLGLSF